MTDEEKINEKLRQCGIDTQSATLEELKRRYPQYAELSDNEKEIERIRQLIDFTKEQMGEIAYEPYSHIIQALVAVGIGDKKQAVKEAFEKLKEQMETNGYRSNLHNRIIDELFTELYGGQL